MSDADGSQITARLKHGPHAGQKTGVDAVEGRPPKTIDLPGTSPNARSRYCLEAWEQRGHEAIYTYLYEV